MENGGLAGRHIEDQFNPTRCGHRDGKNVVDLDAATKRSRAAADARRDPNFLIMARTNVRAVEGLHAAKDRAKALVDAGADAIFLEAMRDLHEFRAIRNTVDVPILANMTEFGKSDLFTTKQLESVGVNMVIYPVTLLRSAMGAAERVLDTLKSLGPSRYACPTCLPGPAFVTSWTTRPTTNSIPASSTSRSPTPANTRSCNEGVRHG